MRSDSIKINNKRSLVLVTVLVFIFMLTIIAGALLAINQNQAKLDASRMQRQKALSLSEAGMWQAIDRAMWTTMNNFTFYETIDGELWTVNVFFTANPAGFPPGTYRIDSVVNWTLP